MTAAAFRTKKRRQRHEREFDSNNNVPKTPLKAPAKQASSFSF